VLPGRCMHHGVAARTRDHEDGTTPRHRGHVRRAACEAGCDAAVERRSPRVAGVFFVASVRWRAAALRGFFSSCLGASVSLLFLAPHHPVLVEADSKNERDHLAVAPDSSSTRLAFSTCRTRQLTSRRIELARRSLSAIASRSCRCPSVRGKELRPIRRAKLADQLPVEKGHPRTEREHCRGCRWPADEVRFGLVGTSGQCDHSCAATNGRSTATGPLA
jgi:hypothetical protein